MLELLTTEQTAKYEEFRSFVSSKVQGCADVWDREQRLPDAILAELGESGYLGAKLPSQYDGKGWDTVTFGLLSEALGRGSSSLAVVVTVQTMVIMALLKWGTPEQKAKWLPALGRGEPLAAFALTEAGAGSATDSITTEFTPNPGSDDLILRGSKKWISCAQSAGLFLVFGKLQGEPLACLLARETPGLRIEPIDDLLGFRAAGLAQLQFNDIKIPKTDLVGRLGFGLSHVASLGLHYGRISTACSASGLLRGCFEDSMAYATNRRIGSQRVAELGMIRSLLARMGTDVNAGWLLCHEACRMADKRSPEAFAKALMAKYFNSRAAVAASSDSIQILGACGCHGSFPTSRYYRDAKIMEIIEGTTQVHEELLAAMFLDRVKLPSNSGDRA